MGLGLTIVLGALFTALQALEYSHMHLRLYRRYLPVGFLHGDWLSRLPCPCRDVIFGSVLAS